MVAVIQKNIACEQDICENRGRHQAVGIWMYRLDVTSAWDHLDVASHRGSYEHYILYEYIYIERERERESEATTLFQNGCKYFEVAATHVRNHLNCSIWCT